MYRCHSAQVLGYVPPVAHFGKKVTYVDLYAVYPSTGLPRQALDLLRASAIAKSAPEHYAFGFGLIPGPRKSGHNAPGDRWARMRASLGWPREMQLYSLKDVGIEELAAKTSVIHAMKQARHESIETTHRYVEHEYAEWERQAVRDRAPSL